MSDTEDDKTGRKSKRQKSSYKAKAFEKFKQLKSGKNKYEVEELENVFDTVDESEYTKRVLERQDDDWIVDDDGSGYVEDGRDVFDDDLDKDSISAASTSRGKSVKRKKTSLSKSAVKSNLHYLLSNMPNKKKEEQKIDDDSALSEILGEISDNSDINVVKPKPILKSFSKFAIKQVEEDYMKGLSSPIIRPKLTKPIESIRNTNQNNLSKTILNETETRSESLIKNTVVAEDDKIVTHNSSNVESSIVEETPIQSNQDNDSCFNDDLDFSQVEEFESLINEKMEKVWENIEEEMLNDWIPNQEEEEETEDVNDLNDINEEIIDSDGKEVFRFFWWDAFEDPAKQPGVVLLFGKTFIKSTKKYVSCCVIVRNIERKLYFLPRTTENDTEKPITHQDVYQEINTIMKSLKVKHFKARPVVKKYAFDPDIPAESDYIEVRYSARDRAISPDIEGKTFSKVFGRESSYLEIMLLDRKIKGPCWLDIINPSTENNQMTWCHLEITCSKPANLCIAQVITDRPPLVVAAVNIRRAINPQTSTNEIVMMSCVSNVAYHVDKQITSPFQKHFCVFSKPAEQMLPANLHSVLKNYKGTTVQKMDSERALVNYFINQWMKLDVDLVVGHDLQGYQINILCERLAHHDNNNFSRFGRLKRTTLIKQKIERDLFVGRLVCDIKVSAKELISSRSYDLNTLCQNVLKMKESQRIDLEVEDVVKMFMNSKDIVKLISLTMQDTANILKIMYNLNIIPLALQITNIAGNVMSKTLLGGRSERNEYLLLHAFSEKDYIVPDKISKKREKPQNKETSVKKKPTYSGGLVLEPKIGFYDRFILLMDFNSLYPSIIQEYNICFTTLPPQIDQENLVLPDKSLPYGILPSEIRKLVESRRAVKDLMKNPDLSADLKMQYHIRQMALKLTANSMYGCLGFTNSRFYAKNLAALITLKGREILTSTKDLVERMHLQVIYGDTDSLMINTQITNYDQVFKIGREIKQEVNKHYRQVELDIDGVFKYLLLLKKKKYAAVLISKDKNGELQTEVEYKGLDIVRRDWSKLAAEAGKFILGLILSEQEPEERSANVVQYLNKVRSDLEANQVPMSLLMITKQLTKDPKQYTDAQSLPHVLVALRCNRYGGGHFRGGDTVSYVVCTDGTTNSHTQRAYLVEEMRTNTELKIDVAYYLEQQIFPVVSRICSPIEDLDLYLIAECLGVDSSKIKSNKPTNENTYTENIREAEHQFQNCKPFVFKCNVCQGDNEIMGPLTEQKTLVLEKCANEGCEARPIDYIWSIQNQLRLAIEKYKRVYYSYMMYCEDPMCTNETCMIPIKFTGRFPICTVCTHSVLLKKYLEREMYYQLLYFRHIFDLKTISRPLMEHKVEKAYQDVKNVVEEKISVCGYSVIFLDDFFSKFHMELINTPEKIEKYEEKYENEAESDAEE